MSEDKITQEDSKEKDEQEYIEIVTEDKDENESESLTPKEVSSETATEELSEEPRTEVAPSPKKKAKVNLYQVIRILCIIGFFVFTALFINEVLIQPYRIRKSIELTRELYNRPSQAPVVTAAPTEIPVAVADTGSENAPSVTVTPTPDPNRDEKGRLLQFSELLATNGDVKGWITIKNTNIDYVVTQPGSDKSDDYYLDKDINGDYSKAGTLYLDPLSSVEVGTQNLVIHGHNMVSTKEKMFHYLLQYNKDDLAYYKEHPVINFDTIYNTGEWKIFSVFITPGNADSKDFFDYRKATFRNSSDFLNFVYQLRIRSVINADMVDINEKDELLTLSTCSYELDNYRTVIVARKVRKGEDANVDVDLASYNTSALYPSKYYYYNGGEAPEVAATFEDALTACQINWYKPVPVTIKK